ncbi:hypothetical protein BPTFM16_02598 [Altererythrobacter insulae]|nr:hypothetical protein BPTFM16_02598 [Altererythrobacter insulae]
MRLCFYKLSAIAVAMSMTPALATNSSSAIDTIQPVEVYQNSPIQDAFTPKNPSSDTRIDYAHWDEALTYLVIPMGPSTREGAPTVQANLGTRRIYGHRSRYRLEGNRVAFSFLNEDLKLALADYRRDLEMVGTSINLSNLARNEQLAFWINLHNVAVIEAIAQAYPMSQPSRAQFGPNMVGLDDAKLVTIKGIRLSPRDIRERIVYPNWTDPKVIYGFFRGEIGGPSIQRLAYTGSNIDQLLSLSAEEFVNSLRGVEKTGQTLRVSRVYEEAAPFYFADWQALRMHLQSYARDDVKHLLERTSRTKVNYYEDDLADLAFGDSDPGLNQFATLADPSGADRRFRSYEPRSSINPGGKIDPAIQRFMIERTAKLKKVFKRGLRTGTVIYGGDPDQARDEAAEVE